MIPSPDCKWCMTVMFAEGVVVAVVAVAAIAGFVWCLLNPV